MTMMESEASGALRRGRSMVSKKALCIICCALLSTIALSVFALGISSAHAAGPNGPGESVGFPGDATVPPDGIDGDASAAAEAGKTDFMSLYTGYSYAEDSNFYYLGGSAALNGDSSRPGFLIEGFAGWGDYSYLNSSVPGGKVDADANQLSVLLGYQVFAGKVELSASAGVDWQDTRLSPKDDMNPVAGSETDFIATGYEDAPSRALGSKIVWWLFDCERDLLDQRARRIQIW
jgi:hypothetical protein